MIGLLVMFWTVLIFTSIAWYGFLVFYLGVKGGKEIRALARRTEDDSKSEHHEGGGGARPSSDAAT